MTSISSYSNFSPQVAEVVTVDTFRHHSSDKPAVEAIKQRWL
jgi:hypothetical protein